MTRVNRGKDRMDQFEKRLTTNTPDELFFSPIKREPLKAFKDSCIKSKLKSDGKTKELAFQRGVLVLPFQTSKKPVLI